MYQLNDEQITFISNDIRARGVEMESLQDDLLDHICCIIENRLEATGDFHQFYANVIQSFYKKELREIETETILLLQNKNYYTMKKVMINSGILSAIIMSVGIFFKFQHLPGAGVLIFTGILLFSFLFLPLLFVLRLKEKQHKNDKILLGLGSLSAILISIGTLFKIMHWPGANVLGISSVVVLVLFYLPVNLVAGIRNPDIKMNTIVTSILIISGCGLFLSLARSPQGSELQYIKNTKYYLRNDMLVKNELALVSTIAKGGNVPAISEAGRDVMECSTLLKTFILEKETGEKELNENFVAKHAWLGESYSENFFGESSPATKQLDNLRTVVKRYNVFCAGHRSEGLNCIPDETVIDANGNERVTDALNNLAQLQLLVLQNERILQVSHRLSLRN
ncbi:MAG TPA: hypothetical protein VFW78_10645 [Bacteroidia bacterium]|nr:hypothetical protein [Bacteroidia bacterium]